jgi:multidrug efflux pump subunit AcrA (membrane-fusion protein)
MRKKNGSMWVWMLGAAVGLASCGVDMPKEKQSSYETMTVEKSSIELPYKFSARMKGQNDVTVTPQVSGQLVKICVSEGQQVKQGQTLAGFISCIEACGELLKVHVPVTQPRNELPNRLVVLE